MVLECTRDEINSVHLIAANEIAKSFTAVEEAMKDAAAGPLLQELDNVEDRVKADERAYRARLKKEIQLQLARKNQQDREYIQKRKMQRKMEEERIKLQRRKDVGI